MFKSNITFGESNSDKQLRLLEEQWALPSFHCCFCDPHDCESDDIPMGTCPPHQRWEQE